MQSENKPLTITLTAAQEALVNKIKRGWNLYPSKSYSTKGAKTYFLKMEGKTPEMVNRMAVRSLVNKGVLKEKNGRVNLDLLNQW